MKSTNHLKQIDEVFLKITTIILNKFESYFDKIIQRHPCQNGKFIKKIIKNDDRILLCSHPL